jgi:nucleotide-binding universal stress UspA family protein
MKENPNTTTLVEEPGSRSPGAEKFSISRILAPTDFSPNSEKAVAYAIQLARRVGAKLTLLHVVPEPSAVDYSMEGMSIQEIQRWEKEAEKKMAELLARAKRAYRQIDAMQVTALHPRDQIVQAATDLAADLMVISTHGYTGWKHLLFGSDAEKIVQHAACPILVVR